MKIDFKTAQEIVFPNNEIRSKLKNHSDSFNTWMMSLQDPVLRGMGKQAIIDFINSIGPEELKIISEVLGEEVEVERMNNKIVMNVSADVNSLEFNLPYCDEYANFAVTRNKNEVKVCLWK